VEEQVTISLIAKSWIRDEDAKVLILHNRDGPKRSYVLDMVRRPGDHHGRSQPGGRNVACTTFDGLLVVPTQNLSVGGLGAWSMGEIELDQRAYRVR
jgi:hypothetical protein